MKKTFITRIPDEPGSFLKPTKIVSDLGLNITRVSYNNSIDTNLLFMEVSGDEVKINMANDILKSSNLLFKEDEANVILMEFKLLDKPNSLLPILELISEFNFNISYISSQENNTPYQYFKMALYIDDPIKIDEFLKQATSICNVRVITYDKTEKSLDNTVFYISFANELANKLDLNKSLVNDLIENSNLVMQILDEKNSSPHKTFEYIAKFGDMLAKYRNLNFKPRISSVDLQSFKLYCIEPPCGSNIYIIFKDNKLLFIDSGFKIYEEEMNTLLSYMFNNYYDLEKYCIITHPDIDHCGMFDMFDRIYVSNLAYENFKLENNSSNNFREQFKNHEPYVKISKILSKYEPPKMDKLIISTRKSDKLLDIVGEIDILGLSIKLFNGNGGHSTGEMVIKINNVWFTGDILVNPFGYTTEQKDFNVLAPYLMSSVNLCSKLALEERKVLENMIEKEDLVCYGHGYPKW